MIPATGYAATWFLDDEEGREQFYWSCGTSLAITYGLKYTVSERRPNGGSHSFPSGHTSSAFQGASFIQQRYGWRYGLPAYLGAAYTGWSRVELDAHYPHDVFAGAAVGILSSYLFTTPYDADRSMGLLYEEDTIGFQINWKW
ncbi:MAG: phosphatase PAP2 family protein [Planctomycetota bacterium]